MTKRLLKPGESRVGPYCRKLDRGALGDSIKATSPEGRFLLRVEQELLAQIAGSGTTPTFAQTLLVRRIARMMLQLDKLDEKMLSGSWTDHDSRTFGGLSNAVRLALRDLGLKPAEPAPQSTESYILSLAKKTSVE